MARVDRLNSNIHAFTAVDRSRALKTARDLDTLPPDRRGGLHGMVVAIKDNIDTKNCRCCAGIPGFQDRIATEDAQVVARLRAEDAVILGVTATDSGAFGVTTPGVINPIRPDHIVGGSSGGSAAAIAADFCDLAIGTDTGGSVRIPAACCGIYGFKPTIGTIPTDGIRPLSPRFDHIGFLARSIPCIERTLAMLGLIAPTSAESRPARIGVPWSSLACIEPDISDAMNRTCRSLRAAGHNLSEVPFPDFDDVLAFHLNLSLADAVSTYEARDDLTSDNLPEIMQESLEIGSRVSTSDLMAAETKRRAYLEALDVLFSQVDFLLLPTLPCLVPQRGDDSALVNGEPASILAALIRFTAPFNQSGHPALSFPDPTCREGFPQGLQLVGRYNEDASLLALAREIAPDIHPVDRHRISCKSEEL